MKNFGKNVNIKSKQKGLSEKDIFVDIINILDSCWGRTNKLGEEFGLDITSYDEPFYIMIENLLYVKYGEWKTDIILWWVYDRFDEEDNLIPIQLNDHDEKTEESVLVETSEDLWNFLKRIDKLEKNK
jgi:hypothetical protein